MTMDITAIILAIISFLSGLGWMLDRKKHRQEIESLKADNRQKDMNRRTSERRGQAGLDYPEREGGNAKRNLSRDYVTEWRTYIAEPLQREVGELRNEVASLRDAIQRIGDCPHRAECPVLDELRKHEAGD